MLQHLFLLIVLFEETVIALGESDLLQVSGLSRSLNTWRAAARLSGHHVFSQMLVLQEQAPKPPTSHFPDSQVACHEGLSSDWQAPLEENV